LNNFQTPITKSQNNILIYIDGYKPNYGLGAGLASFQADSNDKLQQIITQSNILPDISSVFKPRLRQTGMEPALL
jgi:hypothetical protein